jgi:hypothetical protein
VIGKGECNIRVMAQAGMRLHEHEEVDVQNAQYQQVAWDVVKFVRRKYWVHAT